MGGKVGKSEHLECKTTKNNPDSFQFDLYDSTRQKRSRDSQRGVSLEDIVGSKNAREHSTDADNSMFFESSTIPKFFLIFGLPSLLCHLVGSLQLLFQYKLVHQWRLLGRDREANYWGRLGGTKRGIHEERPQWCSSHMVSTQIIKSIFLLGLFQEQGTAR